jgi:hypothetical protein
MAVPVSCFDLFGGGDYTFIRQPIQETQFIFFPVSVCVSHEISDVGETYRPQALSGTPSLSRGSSEKDGIFVAMLE